MHYYKISKSPLFVSLVYFCTQTHAYTKTQIHAFGHSPFTLQTRAYIPFELRKDHFIRSADFQRNERINAPSQLVASMNAKHALPIKGRFLETLFSGFSTLANAGSGRRTNTAFKVLFVDEMRNVFCQVSFNNSSMLCSVATSLALSTDLSCIRSWTTFLIPLLTEGKYHKFTEYHLVLPVVEGMA